MTKPTKPAPRDEQADERGVPPPPPDAAIPASPSDGRLGPAGDPAEGKRE